MTTLEASVEALIQQQVAAYEAELREAVGRKLAGGGTKKRKASKSRASGRQSRATGPRRTPEELEALSQRLLSAARAAHPFRLMTCRPCASPAPAAEPRRMRA